MYYALLVIMTFGLLRLKNLTASGSKERTA